MRKCPWQNHSRSKRQKSASYVIGTARTLFNRSRGGKSRRRGGSGAEEWLTWASIYKLTVIVYSDYRETKHIRYDTAAVLLVGKCGGLDTGVWSTGQIRGVLMTESRDQPAD